MWPPAGEKVAARYMIVTFPLGPARQPFRLPAATEGVNRTRSSEGKQCEGSARAGDCGDPRRRRPRHPPDHGGPHPPRALCRACGGHADLRRRHSSRRVASDGGIARAGRWNSQGNGPVRRHAALGDAHHALGDTNYADGDAATAQPTPTASGGAPLAGRIVPGVTYHGVATAYSAGDGDGACLFGPAANLMIAAMNYTDYETAKACGDYVLVHAADGASITVLITNECPLPCAPGQLDLSQQAFAKLANPALGRIPITWQLLSPAMSRHHLRPVQNRLQPLVVRHPASSATAIRWRCSRCAPATAGDSCPGLTTTTSSPATAADAAARSGSPISTASN